MQLWKLIRSSILSRRKKYIFPLDRDSLRKKFVRIPEIMFFLAFRADITGAYTSRRRRKFVAFSF